MTAKEEASNAKLKVKCPTCTGRRVISVATEDVPCAACKGTGEVPSGAEK